MKEHWLKEIDHEREQRPDDDHEIQPLERRLPKASNIAALLQHPVAHVAILLCHCCYAVVTAFAYLDFSPQHWTRSWSITVVPGSLR